MLFITLLACNIFRNTESYFEPSQTSKIKLDIIVFKKYWPKENISKNFANVDRGGPRAAAASKMERFGIIVNSWKPLTVITKRSILDAAAALDQPLVEVACRIFTLKYKIVWPSKF